MWIFFLNFTKKNYQIFPSKSERSQTKLQWKEKNQVKEIENVVGIARNLYRQMNLPPLFETVKSYAKYAYKTYMLLNPEVKAGQCLVKLVYTRYPGFMRLFRMQNLSRLVRRLYFVLTKYMNNILNGDVFSWYDSAADSARVGSKVAAMTAEDVLSKRKAVQPLNFYEIYPSSQLFSNYQDYLRSFEMGPMSKANTRPRFARQIKSNQREPKNFKQKRQNNMQPMNSGPKQATNQIPKQVPNQINDYDDMDSEARIDLSNKSLEREADELFNIDSMFWKILGVGENSIKKYSLAFCGKEYATDAFKRFIRNVLLS